MTWIELVQKHLPGSTEAEASLILWEMTSFPCGGLEHVDRRLAELARIVEPALDGWKERVAAERERGYEEMDRLSSLGPEA